MLDFSCHRAVPVQGGGDLGSHRAVPVRRGERNLSSHGAVPVPQETKRIKKFLGGLVPTRAGYLTEPHSPEPKRLLEPMATEKRSNPIKRSLVLGKCPAPKVRLREASSVQLCPAFASKALQAFCASLQQLTLLLPVRCAFGAITCKVKHKQSTSELCRERQ